MTFQSKIGTSLPPEREPVRVSLAVYLNYTYYVNILEDCVLELYILY